MGKTRQTGDIVSDGLVSVDIDNDQFKVGTGVTIYGSSGIISATSLYVGGTQFSAGISDVVEDTTPQLGGDLDLNSNDITGTGNFNVTGVITATSYDGQVKLSLEESDTTNYLTFTNDSQGYQTLKSNTGLAFNASNGTLTAAYFSGNGSNITNVNAATLDSIDSASFLRSDQLDNVTSGGIIFNDNIRLNLGTGQNNDSFLFYDGTNANFHVASGDLIIATKGGEWSGDDIIIESADDFEVRLNAGTNIGSGTTAIYATGGGSVKLNHNGSTKFETNTGGATITGTLVAGGLTYPSSDGSSGQVLTTNGQGTISFATVSSGGGGISNVVEDTTPQLGGDLDLNSNDITGTGNFNVTGVITATNFYGIASTASNVTVTTNNDTSDYKVVFANHTGSTTGNYGLLQDSTATFTYNPKTNTLTAVNFSGNGSNLTGVAKLSGQQLYSSGDLRFADNGGIYFGTGYDMYILHYTGGAGTSSGNIIRGNNQNLTLDTLTSGDILIKPVGSVELYENNSKKLETRTDGIAVSGIVTAVSGVVTYYGDGSQLTGISAGGSVAGSDGQIQYNNGGSFGGAAQLYYDDANNRVGINSSSPTSTLDINGTLNVSGVSTFENNVHLLSNDHLYFGSNNDIDIYSDGTTGRLITSDTLYVRAPQLGVLNNAGSQNIAIFDDSNGVSLYHNNSKKFETTGYGVTVIGGLNVSGIATVAEFVGGGSDLRNLSGTHLVSYASASDISNSALSISGISTYNQVGILTGSNASDTNDNFGSSVAASADGKTIIVGAWSDETSGTDGYGLVYVYDREGNNFNEVGILTGSNASDAGDSFGSSVATSADGKTIIVGARSDETSGTTGYGLVYVFDREGNNFNEVGILTGTYASDMSDLFGTSVAVSADGKTIIVGSENDEIPGFSGHGVVYVYDREGNNFNQVGILTGSYASFNDHFGYSVAASADGKTIIVGAYADGTSGSNDGGLVYVFDREGNDFNQVGILTGTYVSQSIDNFGEKVGTSADGKTIIVGAGRDEINPSGIGTYGLLYVYDRDGNNFNQVGILTGSNASDETDGFGKSFAISADGKTIAVSAQQDETSGTGGYGLVYIFNREGNNFNEVGILTGTYSSDFLDLFGDELAISADGKTIIAATPKDEIGTNTATGVVYVFDQERETYVFSDANGNIGIGSAQPTAKLDVNGGLNVSGISTFENNVKLLDSDTLSFGTDQDFKIGHYFGTNAITMVNGNLSFTDSSSNERLKLTNNGNWEIKDNQATTRVTVTTSGATVTGALVAGGLTYPSSDGTNGQVLTTNGQGTLSFTTVSGGGGGISNVVEDTTPQLGGNLDTNGSDITFADTDQAIFGTGSDLIITHSGVHSIISHSGTGNLYVRNTADDKDVAIQSDNGSGSYTDYFFADGSTGESILSHYGSAKLTTKSTGVDITGNIVVSGTVDGRDVATDGTKLDTIATNATAYSNSDVDSHLNQSNPTSGYVLSWNGQDYAWVAQSSGGISNVVEDTTPQLGGDLDLNSNDITGTGNINVTGNLDVSGISTLTNQAEVRSDDGSQGRIDFYCEVNNAHYTRVQAAAHSSYSGNATVTLPSSSGTLLLTDGSGANLTSLNASNLGSGTIPDARFPSTLPAVSGSSLTGLTGAAAATYGDGSNVAAITVDSNGRITGISEVAISGGGASEAFKTITVSGQSDVVADSATDTLTLVAGSNMTITTNATNDTITFASSGSGGSSTLSGLTDVTISNPSNGQVLKYNGSAWVNDTDATGSGGGGGIGVLKAMLFS